MLGLCISTPPCTILDTSTTKILTCYHLSPSIPPPLWYPLTGPHGSLRRPAPPSPQTILFASTTLSTTRRAGMRRAGLRCMQSSPRGPSQCWGKTAPPSCSCKRARMRSQCNFNQRCGSHMPFLMGI